MSYRKRVAAQRAAARKAIENDHYGPFPGQYEAVGHFVGVLGKQGHTVLTQGPSLECCRCGASGSVYPSKEGAKVYFSSERCR